MKNYKSLISLLLFALSVSLQAESMAGSDKKKHFGVSTLLGYGFGYGIEKYAAANESQMSDLFKVSIATSLALSVGLAKEIRDEHFSNEDLLADFAGSLTGALLSNYFHRKSNSFTVLVTPTQPTQLTLLYRF